MILHLNVCGGGKHRHAHSQSLVSGVQGESSLQWSYPGIWNMAVSEYRQWGWEIYRARRELEITNPTNNTDANRCGGTWPNKVWHLWFMMFLRMALGQICQLKRACAKQKWHSFGAHRYSLPWLMHTTSGDRFHMLNAPVGLFWSSSATMLSVVLGKETRGQDINLNQHKAGYYRPNKVWKFWTGCTWLSWEKL